MKTCLPILLSCWLLPTLGIAQHQAADLLRHYRQILPFEKLYLHTDQSVYEPGDNIWFRAYLTDDYNRPSGAASSRIQVQLLDPQGQVVHTANVNTQSTDQVNYIPINATTSGGVYTLRAATQWLFNFGQDAFYEKKILVQKTVLPRLRLKLELDRSKYQAGERVIAQFEALSNDNQALKNIDIKATPILGSTSLEPISTQTDLEGKATIVFKLPAELPNVDGLLQVKLMYEGQNESIARSIPIQKGQVRMGIFPEGGDLVAGFQQKIAFKMMDTLGNPIDGKGTLFNDKHQALLSFGSYHKGMGHFSFSPILGERYYLKIDGQKDSFLLPDPRQDELALRVGLADRDSLPLKIWKRNAGQAQLVLRSKDSIVWQQNLFFQTGESSLKLPVAKLPIGIAQVLVLDEAERPYAERLVFLNRHRQAQLHLSTAKKEYLPLDDVEINIEAHDEMGKPLDGVFSLAVVNDLHWTMADDKQDNILSRLLLSAELKGKIDEPAFYFKPNEPKVPEALDLLMLTHGWRKFTWKEILTIKRQNTASLVLFNNRVEIKGYLMLGHKGIHFPESKVWIKGRNEKISPDSLGHFKFILPESALSTPLFLVAKSKGYRAERAIFQFPKPTIHWPKEPEKAFKALIINEVSEPKIAEDVKEIPILEQAFNPLFELSGELNELVVTGYSVNTLRGLATGSVVAYTNRDLIAGIGDNLFIGGHNWTYQGNNLHIELEKEPLELPYEHVKKEVYNRLYANLPKTDALSETQRRNTIHWAPTVSIKNGKGSLKFHQTDKTGTFRIVLEGVAQQAVVVRGEATYSVQKPVEFAVQVPTLVLSGDTLILDAKVKNRTHVTVTGKLHIPFLSNAFELLDKNQEQQSITILPDTFASIKIPLLVKRMKTQTSIALQWLSGNKVENWKQPIEVQVHGFQHEVAQSSQQAHVVFQLPLSSFIPGSLIANFNAYTMIYQEMVEGLASIIREPYGCFEQVSSSNYPSIMALRLLNETGGVDFAFQKKARAYLDQGYKLLTAYEVNGGGFSIFGHAPASERLTAYGLLQFWDMRSVYPDVDMKMFERNLSWLLKQKRIHYGNYTSDPLEQLFTLYALSEFRPELLQQDLLEFAQKHTRILAEDPYLLSILLCANANVKAVEATRQVQQLKQLLQVQKSGAFKVSNTFGLSYGKNVQTETAAWAILALCKAGQAHAPEVQTLLEFLRSSRDYGGGFGSTQATVIALKALQAFHQQTGNNAEPGKIRVRVNQTWLDTLSYTPKQLQKLQVEFGQWLKPGQNEIEVIQESAEQAIPFLLQANWASSEIPISKQKKALSLQTQYSNTHADQGDFVRLTVKVKNVLERSVNAPMAVIGIPAGLSLQSWQLLDMAKQRVFDHFELKDNYLIVYFESLPKGATKDFQLDLKAEQAGYYQSPSSVAYPYYDAEQKTWVSASSIHIRPSSN